MPLSHRHPVEPGKGAEASWMRALQRTVAAYVGKRPAPQAVDIRLHPAHRDHTLFVAAAALLVFCRFGNQVHESDRGVGVTERRDLGDALARECRVRLEIAKDGAVRRRDLGQRKPRGGSVLKVALGKQHRERRLPVGIGIDVERDADARRPRPIENPEETVGAAPHAPHRELRVRELNRQTCPPADLDQLVDRGPEMAVLAPDVADVAAAVTGGDARQCDELVRRGIDPRVVLEAARETERASRHLSVEQRGHVLHFSGRCLALEVVSKNQGAQPAMADVGRYVHGRGSLLDLGEPIGERKVRPSILADDDGRDALAHGAECVALVAQAPVMMAVRVDEPRSKHEPARIDDGITGARREVANLPNDGADDPNVHSTGGAPRSVHDEGTANKDRTRRHGRLRHGKYDRAADEIHSYLGAQNGSAAGTNVTGTSFTNGASQRANSSIPSCSDGICPRMINAFFPPAMTASATYSTVSHSRASPITSTSTASCSRTFPCASKPAAPGDSPTFVTRSPESPTTRSAGAGRPRRIAAASSASVVSGTR